MSDFSKRYWLFTYDRWEPLGGMEDFEISSDDFNTLSSMLDKECNRKKYRSGHIFDSETRAVIYER